MSAPERAAQLLGIHAVRHSSILPLVTVGALAIAVVLLRPAAEGLQPDAVAETPDSQVTDALPTARSAASMVAEDSLHSLLVEEGRVAQERRRHLAGLDAAHRAEPVDTQSARAAERALAGIAQGQSLVATGIVPGAWSARCRSRSCKVTAVFDDYDDARSWANFFLTGSGGTLAQAELSVQRGANNRTDVLIFGARR
jgi:hypothetical protein